jgi:hypothetical protein
MPNILTSWKEIGQYLGKGVRTVQRWEREAGLPVRRREGHTRHAVLAIPEELDEWVRSHTRIPSGPRADTLQHEVATLRSEVGELRDRLEKVEGEVERSHASSYEGTGFLKIYAEIKGAAQDGSGFPMAGALVEFSILSRENRRLRSDAIRCRAEMIRARLALAMTLCTLAETGAWEKPADWLHRAAWSARELQRSLESPGYVPQGDVEEIRSLVLELVRKIAIAGMRADTPVAAFDMSGIEAEALSSRLPELGSAPSARSN